MNGNRQNKGLYPIIPPLPNHHHHHHPTPHALQRGGSILQPRSLQYTSECSQAGCSMQEGWGGGQVLVVKWQFSRKQRCKVRVNRTRRPHAASQPSPKGFAFLTSPLIPFAAGGPKHQCLSAGPITAHPLAHYSRCPPTWHGNKVHIKQH